MAQLIINTGTVANDGTGDYVRVAWTKANANFTELYAADVVLSGSISDLQDRFVSVAQTYYVATTGNDANPGTVGSPFATLQKAIDTACTFIPTTPGLTHTIQLADGTYSTTGNRLRPTPTGEGVVIQGNAGNAAAVVIQTSGTAASGLLYKTTSEGVYTVQNLTLSSGHSSWLVRADGGAQIAFSNIRFGQADSAAHIRVGPGAQVTVNGNYSIVGSALAHFEVLGPGQIQGAGRTVTLSGTQHFGTAFALATNCGVIYPTGFTFSGVATGKRYQAEANAVINTAGGGASYFPGNVAGTTATGGQYI